MKACGRRREDLEQALKTQHELDELRIIFAKSSDEAMLEIESSTEDTSKFSVGDLLKKISKLEVQ